MTRPLLRIFVPLLMVLALALPIPTVVADTLPSPGTPEVVPVTWDFGSGPGRTSNRWVGKREVPVSYEPRECGARFKLLELQHECPFDGDSETKRVCPAFLSATFKKLVSGDAAIPELHIVRTDYDDRMKPTAAEHTDIVWYPQEMAQGSADDWLALGSETNVGMPAPTLYNPRDWKTVRVVCE